MTDTNLLTATPDGHGLGLALALTTARDLLCLKLTHSRFTVLCIASPSGEAAHACVRERERAYKCACTCVYASLRP